MRDRTGPDPLGRAEGDERILVSADSAGHLIRIRVSWTPAKGGKYDNDAEGFISPEEAMRLAHNLQTWAWSAMTHIAQDYAAGNCETCGNRRLILVTRPGRSDPSNESCPDCRPAWGRAPNDPPVQAGKLADRNREILRHGAPDWKPLPEG